MHTSINMFKKKIPPPDPEGRKSDYILNWMDLLRYVMVSTLRLVAEHRGLNPSHEFIELSAEGPYEPIFL